MKQKIKIEVVSDVVCPWCYIGKRRLENAMQTLNGEYEFEVEYRPFELNPEMPAAGAPQDDYLSKKFGSREKYDSITSHVSGIAAQEGLEFNFDRQKVSPNTRKAHSLLQVARSEGKQLELAELLFRAYFSNGVNLSDEQNLVDIAAAAGIEPSKAKQVLSDENSLLQVALEEQEMYKLGITGVPFYIINGRFGISGAQSSETFQKALLEVGKEAMASENACGVDGENC